MFGKPKIIVESALLEQAKRQAEAAGYACVEDYVSHLIQRDVQHQTTDEGRAKERVLEKMKGLGYLE